MTHWNKPFSLEDVKRFCEFYGLPFEHLPEILEDQKVIPMLRGKGLEFFVFDKLVEILPKTTWKIDKFNVNPQPNVTDADLVITHLPSREEIIVETKTPVRASFKLEERKTRKPRFNVKCHKSRSHMGRKFTNDRYFVDEFDVVVTNCQNAFIESGPEFRLIEDPNALDYIQDFYRTKDVGQLLLKLYQELRFALTTKIAQTDNTLPRTPLVNFPSDENWLSIEKVEPLLEELVKRKLAEKTRKPSRRAHKKK